jgi:hypothetical protein
MSSAGILADSAQEVSGTRKTLPATAPTEPNAVPVANIIGTKIEAPRTPRWSRRRGEETRDGRRK